VFDGYTMYHIVLFLPYGEYVDAHCFHVLSYFMFWGCIDESTIVSGCKSHVLSLCHLLGTLSMETPMVSIMYYHLLCMGQWMSNSCIMMYIIDVIPHILVHDVNLG